jgi:hypothetical protein
MSLISMVIKYEMKIKRVDVDTYSSNLQYDTFK